MPSADEGVIERLAARPALHCNFTEPLEPLRHTRGDSCQFRVPRLSPVMDEPVSFSHLGCVIEALVVSQPHVCSHKVKKVTCPALKALQHFTQTVVWRTFDIRR